MRHTGPATGDGAASIEVMLDVMRDVAKTYLDRDGSLQPEEYLAASREQVAAVAFAEIAGASSADRCRALLRQSRRVFPASSAAQEKTSGQPGASEIRAQLSRYCAAHALAGVDELRARLAARLTDTANDAESRSHEHREFLELMVSTFCSFAGASVTEIRRTALTRAGTAGRKAKAERTEARILDVCRGYLDGDEREQFFWRRGKRQGRLYIEGLTQAVVHTLGDLAPPANSVRVKIGQLIGQKKLPASLADISVVA